MVKDEITLKGIFERVVALEAKFDYAVEKGNQSQKYFKILVFAIITVEIINFFLNTYLILWR